jgi:hypothetical protein
MHLRWRKYDAGIGRTMGRRGKEEDDMWDPHISVGERKN